MPKPAERVFASLRRAGLRLARLKPVFISASHGCSEHLFLPPFRVAASCIFQSAAEFANNSVVCHSEEQSDEESLTLPKIDSSMTIMASMSRRLFLIRKTLRPGPARAKSATPAAGPGERFARKCVVNNFGRSLRGTPGDSRMFAGLRRPRLRPARLKRAARCTGNRSKPLFAFSAAFLRAIALCTCCGRPQT